MIKRECNICGENKKISEFSKSYWDLPEYRKVSCKQCKARKYRGTHKKDGIVYVLINKAWGDWCKIGATSKTIENRIAHYQIGDPLRAYKIVYTIDTNDMYGLENKIHNELKSLSVENKYEWFKIKAPVVIELIIKDGLDRHKN